LAEYGLSDAFLKAHPDVQAKVTAAIAGDWEPDKFLDELKKTAWWRKNTDAQRRWDILIADNPRQAQDQLTLMANRIQRMLATMGMAASFNRARAVAWARMAVRNGMDEAELRYFLGTQFSHGGDRGLIGTTRAALTAMKGEYGVAVSTAWMNKAIETVLQGVNTVEDYRQGMINAAKILFPAAAQALDAGQTTRQIMEPYLAIAAQELGRTATSMNINDPLWNRALTYRGEKPVSSTPQHMMSQDEWVRTIRTDRRYGWDSSQNAQKAAATLTGGLAQMFGAMGG
jgi:hypothetical protein